MSVERFHVPKMPEPDDPPSQTQIKQKLNKHLPFVGLVGRPVFSTLFAHTSGRVAPFASNG